MDYSNTQTSSKEHYVEAASFTTHYDLPSNPILLTVKPLKEFEVPN